MVTISPPPGWYRDPTSASPQLRYWDGSVWGDACRPYAPPRDTASDDANRGLPARRSPRLGAIKWGAIAAFVLGVGVIVFALLNGQLVKDVDLVSGKVSFYSSADPSEVAQAQPEAEETVAVLEEQAREQAVTQPEFSGPDLSGTWVPVGGSGQWYELSQFGDQVVVQEVTPWGLTASGSGTAAGDGVSLTFSAYNGVVGTADLRLVGSSTLHGTLTSSAYGTTPVQWERSSP